MHRATLEHVKSLSQIGASEGMHRMNMSGVKLQRYELLPNFQFVTSPHYPKEPVASIARS